MELVYILPETSVCLLLVGVLIMSLLSSSTFIYAESLTDITKFNYTIMRHIYVRNNNC